MTLSVVQVVVRPLIGIADKLLSGKLSALLNSGDPGESPILLVVVQSYRVSHHSMRYINKLLSL